VSAPAGDAIRPSPPTGFAVAILTGGRSRRMGTDKAFVEIDGRPLVDDYVRTITVSEESEAVVPSVATYYARWQFLVPAIISSVAATVAFGIAGEEAAYGGGVSEVLLGVGGAFGGAGLVLFVPSFLPRSGWDLKPLKASR